jgi:hypothetical protein
VLIGRALTALGLTAGGVDWGDFRREVAANTDVRKFDDMLRCVLDGTAEQRERLTTALEESFRRGRLAYGMHVAGGAIMTCMVRSYAGEHFHFVDGAGGGYALAAVELKRRLARLSAADPAGAAVG